MKKQRSPSKVGFVGYLAKIAKQKFCVAVTVAGGYGDYLWFPPCGLSEFESFWKSIPNLSASDAIKQLGGVSYSYLDTRQIIKTKTYYPALKHYNQLWARLYIPNRYRVSICCDEDSYLITPDDRIVLHSGFIHNTENNNKLNKTVKLLPTFRANYFKPRTILTTGIYGCMCWQKRQRGPTDRNRLFYISPDLDRSEVLAGIEHYRVKMKRGCKVSSN